MRQLCWFAIFTLYIAGTVSDVHAGPWTRKTGTAFVQLGFSSIGYNKVYDDRSEKAVLPVDVRDNVLQFLLDYGVAERLSLSATLPVKFLSLKGKGGTVAAGLSRSNSGIGDIDVAVKYNLHKAEGFVVSAEALFGLPTGQTRNENGLCLGDGEFNVTARALAGKSFHPIPFYITVDIGVNFRTGDFSHDIPFNVEVGYGLFESKLFIGLLISGRESLSNQPTLGPNPSLSEQAAAGLGLYGNNLEYLAIVPKVFYKIDSHWGVSASFATAAHGRNVAGGVVLAAGVAYEF